MIKELEDYYGILQYVHDSVNKFLEGLSDEQWLQKIGNFNNIASIIDHMTAVEIGFMKVLKGEKIEKMPAESFEITDWDISEIKKQWSDSLSFSREVLAGLTENELDKKVDLGLGMDLNKRQLIILTISHLTHHRGQIPLVKKVIDK